MISRRSLFLTAAAAALLPAAFSRRAVAAAFEVTRTEAEWRAILSPAQYAVLRDQKTEKPFSNSLIGEASPLLKEARNGTYACAGCDLAVYKSDTKFDSGTGWPSFFDAIKGNVGLAEDNTLFATRTEVHCRRCGGHLGHMFDDGPKPTGKRYCMNGLAMTFTAA